LHASDVVGGEAGFDGSQEAEHDGFWSLVELHGDGSARSGGRVCLEFAHEAVRVLIGSCSNLKLPHFIPLL
jgi:hypothetical protein